jgi:hypothetical protein
LQGGGAAGGQLGEERLVAFEVRAGDGEADNQAAFRLLAPKGDHRVRLVVNHR